MDEICISIAKASENKVKLFEFYQLNLLLKWSYYILKLHLLAVTVIRFIAISLQKYVCICIFSSEVKNHTQNKKIQILM
jgi:hypothetical protein